MGDVKREFGEQLIKYRKKISLTQAQYAKLHDTSKSYINKLENGGVNIQIESMEQHAQSFGVTHYQFSNPEHLIPALSEMPEKTRKAVADATSEREQKAHDKQAELEKTGKTYKIGLAEELHKLIAEGFFNEQRTSKVIFIKLNPHITSDKDIKNSQEINNITSTLSKGKFKALLEKLAPLEGQGRAVRFVVIKKSGKAGRYKK